MTINPNLLIAAPMLQDYFVDNANGEAMSAGVITCYQDNSRTTLKNWYYQSGSPGNYTYIALPNPMTLSAVGTIVDVNGNDTIPFFYPYSENDQNVIQTYYITAVNSNGQVQWSRQNFPFLPGGGAAFNAVPTLRNIIANNVFYHNIGTQNLTSVTNTIIAPSQHDGFMAANLNDWRFIKNITGGPDTITFMPFLPGNSPLMGDITPEYYINLQCTGVQTGETQKIIRVPISLHIKTLESVMATITLQAQNLGTNNEITIGITQYLGSNSSPTYVTVFEETIPVSSDWTKYPIPIIFPSAESLSVSNTGDDALFLDIQFPLSQTFNLNIAKPSIYLSNVVPTNDFETYDQIDTIISDPRTGDVRVSLNNFAPFGWVPMNDGTIGNSSSGSTTRANIDTWNLFYLIWNSVGATNAPMFNSSGGSVSYGASAYADWNANNRLSLTKQLGSAIASAGLAASNGVTTWTLGQNAGEQQHTQLLTELVSHNHSPLPPATGFITNSTGTGDTIAGGNIGSSGITANTGGGQPFNITQPTTFYNVFMKL